MHFRKSTKSSEIRVFFPTLSIRMYRQCMMWSWFLFSEALGKNYDRILCITYCHNHAHSSANDSPEEQSKLLERQSSKHWCLSPTFLPSSVVLLIIWCSLDESSDFSRYVCIIWHISSASSTWGFWVTWKGFLWSIGLQHGEIPPFIIQQYICCMLWVIQQLYIFPVKCGIPPVFSYSLTLYCWNKSSFLCFKVFLGDG